MPSSLDISRLDDPRIVVDNRFSEMSDSEAEGQILDAMRYLTKNGACPTGRCST